MNAGEFLEVAKLIGGPGGPYPEGRHRTAVSRAYYCAFLDARERVRLVPHVRFQKNNSHDVVWKALTYGKEPLKAIGRSLRDLKAMREKADYDISASLAEDDAAEAIQLAVEIVSKLSTADMSACGDPDKGPLQP